MAYGCGDGANSLDQATSADGNKFVTINKYEVVERFGVPVKGKLMNKKRTAYNKIAQVVEEAGYNENDELENHFIYTYDGHGNRVSAASVDKNDNVRSKYVYTYDNNHNRIETNTYNADGILKTKIIFQNDANGNPVEEIRYDEKGAIKTRAFNKYSNEQLLELNMYDEKGIKQSHETFAYDTAGNKIEWVRYDKNGLMENRITYQYDYNNNVKQQTVLDKRRTGTAITVYTYETHYDRNNNWTMRIEFKNDTPSYMEVYNLDICD
ncbi:MAG: hypothetical protein LBS94_03295 [Prevotellaceae bacterium]|nr:hypothetical protein [Prevotellaceae bacterium]